MTDPTKLTPEELKKIAAREKEDGVVDQQSAAETPPKPPTVPASDD